MNEAKRQTHSAPSPVVEEERLLETVSAAIARPVRARQQDNYGDELVRLRDSMIEERLAEDRASIIEQMERISSLAATRARHTESAIDPASPYFGHMRLVDEEGERRDILIGKATWISGGVRIVDWRNAPISKLFYQLREGDDYALVIADREVEGEVALRRTLTIRDGELVRVATPEASYVRGGHGWVDLSNNQPSLHGGQGSAARPDRTRAVLGVKGSVPSFGARRERADKHLPEIASMLDPEQFALITRRDSGLVAVQGSAGSGKTTVALHRVAWLAYEDKRFASPRTLIVVFSRALSRYISQVLPALGVTGPQVRTYESWVQELRRSHFPHLPAAYSDDTPAVVSRFKQHRVLIPMLEDAATRFRGRSPMAVFDELFTSRAFLREGTERWSSGAFSDGQIDEIHRWCTRQHFTRIDGGGPNEDDIPTMDVEDDTLLLKLHQLVKGPLQFEKGRKLRYAHLVVDEAQDLSPVELSLLLSTVEKGAPVTLAGDVAQKVMEDNDFGDWRDVLDVLEQSHVHVSPLRVSYRSTEPIMRLARDVLGHLAPDEPVAAPRDGASPELFRFGSRGEAITFLADSLRDLVEAEPLASIAVLTRHAHQADDAYEALRRADLPALSRVRDQDFSFAPGVEVTDIRQAKGLEFDYVVMFDVDTTTFPVSDASRHLLHVGITRAAHQCWLVCVGPPTLILPGTLEVQAP